MENLSVHLRAYFLGQLRLVAPFQDVQAGAQRHDGIAQFVA